MVDKSHTLINRSWPTVSRRFRSSSRSICTMECLASWKAAREGRSTVCSCLKQGSQQRTSNSKPIIGILIRFDEQLSQTALPQWRQWCCRMPKITFQLYCNLVINHSMCKLCHLPNCFWSIIERKFQKNGLEHSWQLLDSTQPGTSLRIAFISQNTTTESSPHDINCWVWFAYASADTLLLNGKEYAIIRTRVSYVYD